MFIVEDEWFDQLFIIEYHWFNLNQLFPTINDLINIYYRLSMIWLIFIIDYQWFDGTESEADLWPPRCRGEREQPETRNTKVRGHIFSFKETVRIIQS